MHAGTWASKRLVVNTAPALVVASAAANFDVSTNVRAPGPARSIGAMLVIRCDSAVPSRATAPVNEAISVSVSDFALVELIRPSPPTRSGESGSRACNIYHEPTREHDPRRCLEMPRFNAVEP